MSISDVNMRMNNQSPMPRSTEEKDGIRYDSEFSRIEELIKGNTFSREEISHLMEILNSRVENDWEKQKSTSNAEEDTQLVSWTNHIQGTPSEEKQKGIDQTMIGTFREKSAVPVEASASPIDIARAYMAGRTTEAGHDPHNFVSKGERAQPSNEFARNPHWQSPSPKPSICWPGAMVPNHHGYTTPQNHRGRQRVHDFPRTPYSRTIFSKSSIKLQADSSYENTPAPFQHIQTSIYGQVKSRGDTIDGYGSMGPIRRIRNKFASEARPRGTIFPSSPKKIHSKIGTPKVSGGFLPTTPKNSGGDNISDSSDRDISNSNLSSSDAVRKILEHLDRSKPTPKEKEAELKLATAWRRSSPTEENISSVHSGELACHKNTDVAASKFPVEFNNSISTVKFHDKGTDEPKDVDGNAQASSSVFTGSNAMPSFGFKGTSGTGVKNPTENAFATTTQGESATTSFLFSHPPLSNGQDVKKLAGPTGFEFSKNQGTKPSLPSISINRPDFRAASTFTFPVSSVSSGVLSEPPTPSIIPSSSASMVSSATPSYAFGTNKSNSSLIFAFPSTSSAPTVDNSDLKFSFGSDKKTRLSFSSFDKDAICY